MSLFFLAITNSTFGAAAAQENTAPDTNTYYRDHNGDTPLHLAIHPDWTSGKPRCRRKVIQALIASGVNQAWRNAQDLRAIQIPHIQINALKKATSHDIPLLNHYNMTLLLLKTAAQPGDVNEVTPSRKSKKLGKQLIGVMRCFIARKIHWERAESEVRRLLSQGAYVNAHDLDGNTALHYAVRPRPPHNYFASNIIRRLLLAGANLQHENREGLTPLEQIQEGKCATLYPDNYLEGVLKTIKSAVNKAIKRKPQRIRHNNTLRASLPYQEAAILVREYENRWGDPH